jgi:type II secretory pathway component GspD/PulD (secretin)
MLSAGRRMFVALALTLVAAHAAAAQGDQSAQKRDEDNYVTQKIFQNRVFDIKNRDPQALSRVLAPLTSGFRGAVVSPNQEFRTITVRDFPENIAVIEEAIRRLDTPEQTRPSVEFRVHMLVASNDETVANRYPSELSDVVKQLQSSLGLKNFSLMGSQVVRSKEGNWEANNKGVADFKLTGDTAASKNPVFYNYNIRQVTLDTAGGQPRVQVGEFYMSMKVPLSLGPDKLTYEDIGFRNPVTLRDGEKVVVGTTNIADKNIIVVISAITTK